MSDNVRCDRHVGEPWAPRCSDCEREQIIAANPVPDTVPDFVTPEQFGEDVLELTRRWLTTIHPIDAAEAITDLADRTSFGRAVQVAHDALHAYLEQVTFHASSTEQVTRLRIVPAIAGAIKRMSPGHLTAPDDLRQDHHSRGSGHTPRGIS